MVLGPTGNRRCWGFEQAPTTIPEGGGLRPPPLLLVLEAWGAYQGKEPHIFKNHYFLESVWFLPWYPRPPKHHLANTNNSGSR